MLGVDTDALCAVGSVAPPFHVKVLPLLIVAINTSPKESKDQSPGSRVCVEAATAIPQPVSDPPVTTPPNVDIPKP